MSYPKVLAITRRTADLCATQGLLYSAGFRLMTATNITAARGLIKAVGIQGVIVCHHSWTAEERDQLVADLNVLNPRIKVVMRCPGCTGRGDHKPGTLCDTLPLTSLVLSLTPNA